MPKPKLLPPMRGASNAQPFVDTPGDSNPPGAMSNVRPRRKVSGRRQIGSRPGMRDIFGRVFGAIQAMLSVSRTSGISGYETGAITRVTQGLSVGSDKFRGQFAILDEDWSMWGVVPDNRGTSIAFPPNGPGGYSGFHVAWNPNDPNIGYTAMLGLDVSASTQAVVIVGLSRVSYSGRTFTHQTYALDTDTAFSAGSYPAMPATGQGDLYSNKLACNGAYLFLAVRECVYVFRADDLTYVKRHIITDAAGRVVEEVQSLCCFTVGGVDYLAVLCEGSRQVSGPFVADPGPSRTTYFGWFGRSGIHLHTVNYADTNKTPVAMGSAALTFKRMPQGTQSGDANHEDHGTFRISEWSLQRPRGPLVWDMDIGLGEGGEVYAYIARTNQGFGYDGGAGRIPDGSVAYVSACRAVLTRAFESDAPTYMAPTAAIRYGFGVLQGGWETDTGSLRKAFSWHGSTYSNDIPNSAGDLMKHDPGATNEAPTFMAVAADEASDRVFFGGRRPSPSQALPNVHCLRASDGAPLWSKDLAGLVQQASITINPANRNVIVGCNRTNQWDGGGGTLKRELFELDGASGDVVNSFDLGDAVTQNTFIGPWNEQQTITITGSPTGGTFTLTFAGQTTAAINHNANAAAVQSALEALSNIAPGDVAVTGGPGPGTPWVVDFQGVYALDNVGVMTAASSLTGGTSPAVAVTTTRQGGITPGVYGVAANSKGQLLVALAPYRYDS